MKIKLTAEMRMRLAYAEELDITDIVAPIIAERDALAATVEALRKIFPLKVLVGCDANLNYPVSQYNDMVEAFNASPQQHLRDVRAEAVLDAIKSCVVVNCIGTNCISVRGLNQYASRVKEGKL